MRVIDGPLRVPYDLPHMTVGILKTTCVATPESILRRFHNDGALQFKECHCDLFEFGANNTLCRQTHPVAVKAE